MAGAAISYIRVSTAAGPLRLGLEAQRRAIAEFCEREGLAIVVAKLDRLSRDVAFVTGAIRTVAIARASVCSLSIHVMAASRSVASEHTDVGLSYDRRLGKRSNQLRARRR